MQTLGRIPADVLHLRLLRRSNLPLADALCPLPEGAPADPQHRPERPGTHNLAAQSPVTMVRQRLADVVLASTSDCPQILLCIVARLIPELSSTLRGSGDTKGGRGWGVQGKEQGWGLQGGRNRVGGV